MIQLEKYVNVVITMLLMFLKDVLFYVQKVKHLKIGNNVLIFVLNPIKCGTIYLEDVFV